MADRRLLVLPLLALASPARAAFAPPLDQAVYCTIVETRGDGETTRTFTSERSIVFRRDGEGYTAEFRFLPRAVSGAKDARAMLDAALAALSGTPIRFGLDRTGRVTAIDDIDGVWSRLLAAIGGMARGDPGRTAMVRALSQGFAALPAAQREKMLASMLAPTIAASDADRAPGEDAPVSIVTDRYGGGRATLAGRETTRLIPTDLIEITTRATGDAATLALPDMKVTLLRVREVDRRTGLIRRMTEEA